jgi:BioD-like phosphotransacetylase family protein
MGKSRERRLYVAATHQHGGKTTCSLGFVKSFSQLGHKVGFIKPVGQRYVTVDGQQIDEDSLLLQDVCEIHCPLKDMSPLAVERSFTREYLDNPEAVYPKLVEAIKASYAIAADDNELMVIEGTGHAGVGSVFDLSNAHVARLLDARVIIVTPGGIGRPVDEVAVNCSLFEKEGVCVVGVVANKVLPSKLEQTQDYLGKAFARKGLPLLGTIPYAPRLSWPTVDIVIEAMRAKVLNGKKMLHNEIADVIVAAMTPRHALKYVRDKTLVIVPGDREDIVLAVVNMHILRKDLRISGIVLTGGLLLDDETMALVAQTSIPLLSVKPATYDTAARIHDIAVKIHSDDKEKIELAAQLVRDHVNMGAIWELLG